MSISVEHVVKYYGEQKALDDVSFEIKTGEIVGFLGPNGAGKSTMMKIISGFMPASSGNVSVNGIAVEGDGLEVKSQLGYLPENNPLYPEMYVREYLDFVASFYKIPAGKTNQINKVIELTGLSAEQNKKIGSLSKGYRQRTGLAQALINDPAVLILDEATTGLDPNQIVEIRNLIREAGKEKTVMLSTHIMQEVEAICDRVIIIDKGHIVADETMSNINSVIKKPRQQIVVEFDKDPESFTADTIKNISAPKKLKEKTWLIEATGSDDIRPAIFRFAVDQNLTVLSMVRHDNNLEEIFRQLTAG
jgi:ABC-2 type transport system ATP-binding protein